jgi:hypothetical protein
MQIRQFIKLWVKNIRYDLYQSMNQYCFHVTSKKKN